MPIVLFNSHLPESALKAAEVAIAFAIVGLAARLLYRWRKGALHIHEHDHGDARHSHVHGHAAQHGHVHSHRARSPFGAFGIGLVHGMGGSAGVGILIVATIDSTAVAAAALVLLAAFTAVSMTILSGGFGATLVSRPFRSAFSTIAPVLGLVSLAFGIWYGLSALELTPYYF
jgi:hypothetical protein